MKPHIVALCSPNQSRLDHLRKLAQLGNRYVITCCRIGPGQGWEHRFVDHDVEIPEGNLASCTSAAVELLRPFGTPDGIINMSEAYVPLHTELCGHYGLVGPSRDAARIGRNKYYMRQFCAQLDIRIPNFTLTTADTLDECESLDYPVVVKPVIGCSSTLVQRVDSHADLLRRFPEILNTALCVYRKELLLQQTLDEFGDFPFLVEEMAGGSVQFETSLPYLVGEISVESIAHDGRTTVLAIHDAPVPSNGPFYEKVVNSTPTRIPPTLVERARTIVSRLHEALGSGAYVLHTEMRTFEDDLLLLEFGVRIGGSSLYKSVLHSTGNDFIEILIQLSLGERPALNDQPAVPTITHYIVPESEGRIACLKGISKAMTSPYFRDLQLYDDVGDAVRRPPLRNRASGYLYSTVLPSRYWNAKPCGCWTRSTCASSRRRPWLEDDSRASLFVRLRRARAAPQGERDRHHEQRQCRRLRHLRGRGLREIDVAELVQAIGGGVLLPAHRRQVRETGEVEGLERQRRTGRRDSERFADRAAAGECACKRDSRRRIEREVPRQVDRQQRERVAFRVRQGDRRRREGREAIRTRIEQVVPGHLGDPFPVSGLLKTKPPLELVSVNPWLVYGLKTTSVPGGTSEKSRMVSAPAGTARPVMSAAASPIAPSVRCVLRAMSASESA